MLEQLLKELDKADIETRKQFAEKIVEILNEVSNSTGKTNLLI